MTPDRSATPGLLPFADRALRDQCRRLLQLSAELLAGEPGVATQNQAGHLWRAIDSILFRHHRDEEAFLFPALLEAMAGSDAVCLRELTEFLAAEHRALESSWRGVRHALARIEAGEPEMAPVSETIDRFVDRCLRHLEREEQELFPMAARLLSDDELATIEQKFRPPSAS